MRFRSRARGRGRDRHDRESDPAAENPFALLEQEQDREQVQDEEQQRAHARTATAEPDEIEEPPVAGPLAGRDRIVAGEPRPRPRVARAASSRSPRSARDDGDATEGTAERGGERRESTLRPSPSPSPGRRLRLRRLAVYTALFLIVMPAVPVTLFRFVPPPASAMMMKRWVDARAEGRAFDLDYDWTPREEIARSLRQAVVASEDQRFYDHAGFDWKELQNALDEWRDGGSLRGASTISQQVAKNLFLWPGRSFLRKVFEAWFTIWIEWLWPKQRILEVYLNIAELGDGVFGAEAASRRYFKHSAAKLVPHESALLAASLPSPLRSNPANPSAYLRRRQSWILRHLRIRFSESESSRRAPSTGRVLHRAQHGLRVHDRMIRADEDLLHGQTAHEREMTGHVV
ncbi:monofunctional biosynthetic peptidoglycan transglycosylase, partial [Myxococcota bacterium]|nr:monofunctional biosynthetic peptidoglycan transglycosylase [Myxococcota bacterium]